MRPGMHASLGQNMQLQQRMVLAPQIIQSIEILQLPIMALQERIDQELLENPALDAELANPEEEEENPEPRKDERTDKDEEDGLDSRVEELGDDWGEYFSGRGGGTYSDDDEDKKLAAMQNTAARTESLHEYLIAQLALQGLADATRELCESIIYSLDANGYLLYNVDELLQSDGVAEPDPDLLAEIEDALRIVQSFEPKGVACRDIQECLLLQIPDEEALALPRSIILNHLEDLRLNRLPKIGKETSATIEEVKDAIHYISTLNPRPGSEFSSGQSQYVIPDVIVEYVDGRYEITLQDGYIPRLKVSRAYELMLHDNRNDTVTKDFVRKKIQAARWLMESIEQRRSTVYKIASEIVRRQKDFFDKGIAYLHPLKMQAVADETGVHVSTVSRAISEKFIQTPMGIYRIKYFFTGGIDSVDGSQVSTKSVQQALVDIISNEDKNSPLSDEEIVARLKGKDMGISRRTVTKYRKQLSIPSSRQRREY